MVKTFEKKYLINTLNLPDDAISDDIIDKRRWSDVHEIIFKDNDKYYRAFYTEGSTENCDERAWDFEDEIECTEVHEVEKLIKVWEDC